MKIELTDNYRETRRVKMEQCEKCGKYFHPDEISWCRECDMELCQSCYNKYMKEQASFDEEDDILDENE